MVSDNRTNRMSQLEQAQKARDAMSEREKILEADRRSRASQMGGKFRALFGIQIALLILAAVLLIVTFTANAENVESRLHIIIVIALAVIVLSVVYGVIIISLGKFHDAFSGAGALYITAQIASCIKSFLGTGNAAGSLFSLVASALSIGYMLKFCEGMIDSFESIESGVADDWESYKKAFLIATIGAICSIVVLFMPGLFGLGYLGSIVFAIMSVVVSIWLIILLYNSSVEMTTFSLSPIAPSKHSSAGAFRNISVSGSKSAATYTPAPARKPAMSREEAIKKAEEMRLRREGKLPASDSQNQAEKTATDLAKEQETVDMIKKYKDLLDAGAITEEEFEAKKKELL